MSLLGFLFGGDSKSSSTTSSTSQDNHATDNRIGLDGTGNIGQGAGSSYTLDNSDKSATAINVSDNSDRSIDSRDLSQTTFTTSDNSNRSIDSRDLSQVTVTTTALDGGAIKSAFASQAEALGMTGQAVSAALQANSDVSSKAIIGIGNTAINSQTSALDFGKSALQFASGAFGAALQDQDKSRAAELQTLTTAFQAQRSEGTQLSSDLIKWGAIAVVAIAAFSFFRK